MPLINFKCSCGHSQNNMIKSSELKGLVSKKTCPECGKKEGLVRQIGAAASNTKMVIDNGSMVKAVETLTDIIEINAERGKSDDSNKGTTV